MIKKVILSLSILSSFLLFLAPATLSGGEEEERLPQISGYVQTWWTLVEQLENGVRQGGAEGDLSQQNTFGFNLARARVALSQSFLEELLGYRIEVKLEEKTELLDYYLKFQPLSWMSVSLGQMKIPSTYEVLEKSNGLDFISRSSVSGQITDWALSRTPFISPFMGNRSRLRDLGLAFKGQLVSGRLDFFLMAGNGLGSNLFIGGWEKKQFVATNDIGKLFYGARIDVRPLHFLTVGGHASYNYHNNMLLNDERTVMDLNRVSYSADIRAELPYRINLTALYAGGEVDDNYHLDGKINYRYRGYEVKAIYEVITEKIETGLRFDVYEYEFNESGSWVSQQNFTIGANAYPIPYLKVQMNYIYKHTDESGFEDLNDNILYAQIQCSLP